MKPTTALTLAPALTPARTTRRLALRLRITEACNWIRDGAPGRALEVLESLRKELKPK